MRGSQVFEQLATRPPFTKLHPKVAAFLKDYFVHEKAIEFDGRLVVNTHFPPYPSRAFDNLTEGFNRLGSAEDRRLYSVTLAVTNRCLFKCWHCYNAGRSQQDLTIDTLERVIAELQDLGAVMVTLTGGEPLLRDDLAEIVNGARGSLAQFRTPAGGRQHTAEHQVGNLGVFDNEQQVADTRFFQRLQRLLRIAGTRTTASL